MPWFTPWLIALSVLLVGSAWRMCDKLSSHLARHLDYEMLESMLSTNNAEQVLELLRRLIPSPEEQTGGQSRKSHWIETSVSLRNALIAGKTRSIALAIREVMHGPLAASVSSSIQSSHQQNTKRVFLERMENYQLTLKSFEITVSRISQLENDSSSARTSLQLIEQDLRDLLSLGSARSKTEDSHDVFADGVLRDLPLIQELKPSPQDLIALREQLERIGGRVRIDGENAHEEFTERLNSMRAVSQPIAQRLNELRTQLVDLKSQRKKARDQLKRDRNLFKSANDELLLSLVSEVQK